MNAYMLKNGGVILGFYSTEEKASKAAEKDIDAHFKGSIVDKDPWPRRILQKNPSQEELCHLWVLSPSGIFYTISKISIQ